MNESSSTKKMVMIPMLLQMVNETFLTPLQHSPFIYVLLLAIFFILLRRWFSNTDSSIPPSPPKLPIIGNLHQVSSLPHRDFQTLSKKYGPIMLLHFGSRPVLVISSAEAASQILKTHELVFAERPKFIFFEKVIYNYKDMVGAPYGEYWRQLRSVSLLNLLNNKMIRSYRSVRLEETRLMMESILNLSSTVINLSEMFIKISNDVACRIAIGRRYSDLAVDSAGKAITRDLTEFFTKVNIGDFIPWLSWVTRFTGMDAALDDLAKRTDAFMEMVVEDHIDRSNSGDVGKNNDSQDKVIDFVDVLLSVQKEGSSGISIDRLSIKATILDVFAGGTDTIFVTLDWVMAELMKNPRVMKKVQDEVRTIVGNKEEITEDDLVGMHYMKAVIKEGFRLHPPFPLLPRVSRQDVIINGYTVKAKTQVMVNSWGIGRDSKSFTNPEMFEPERFLNSSMDYKGNDFELIPFGAGRRGCPGINFAMVVVEIVLANVLQKFDWELPDGIRANDLDMSESTGGPSHRNNPLKVVAKPYVV